MQKYSFRGMLRDVLEEVIRYKWPCVRLEAVADFEACRWRWIARCRAHVECSGCWPATVDDEPCTCRCPGRVPIEVDSELMRDDRARELIAYVEREVSQGMLATGCTHYLVRVPNAESIVAAGGGL